MTNITNMQFLNSVFSLYLDFFPKYEEFYKERIYKETSQLIFSTNQKNAFTC